MAPGVQHLQQRGLHIEGEFVDLVKEQNRTIGLPQEARPFAARLGAPLAQQRGQGAIAERGACLLYTSRCV